MSTPSNPQPTPVAATQIRVQAQRRLQGAASLVFTPDLIYVVDSYTGNPNEIVMTGPTGIINPNLLPPSSNIQLLTNGVINADQSRLNLVQGTNIVITADAFGNTTISASGSFSTSFGSITTGDNTTATMTVDSGASIIVAGTGIVEATELATNTATPVVTSGSAPTHPGQILISQPGNATAIWADPQVQGLYPAGSSIASPPPYSPPTTIQPVLVGGQGESPSGKDGLLHPLPLTTTGGSVQTFQNPTEAINQGYTDPYQRARVSSPITLFEESYQLFPVGPLTTPPQ